MSIATLEEIDTDVDATTRRWIRNASDVAAVKAGCRFDEAKGQFVCDWIERHCHLYEGSRALMKLLPWEREATMRIFGWVRWGTALPSGDDDRWIRRFTKAVIFMPKKSGKSPYLAALALYLTAGDGEQGNHVFFTAADGGQARIAAKHAVEMVKASPELDAEQGGEIRINLTEMKLTHLSSGSDAKPISSGDKIAAQRKQGINGCICIDELHVVSFAYISESSIDRAGSSRDEPLFLAVSTAGKDPDSYGRSQYDYGKLVESGEAEDHGFFFLCYEAPQDLSDEDLDADPVKWGRMANPAWGKLTREAEFLADYQRSKRSLSDLADFKTFRLNIWQKAASPWIRAGDWKQCQQDYTEQDLLGKPCAVGLDLSKTRDMTALVLCFPWEDGYRLLPYFFLPEAAVERLSINFPQFLDWVRQGYSIQTEGNVLDYAFLKAKLNELAGKFSFAHFVFDKSFGAEFINQEFAGPLGIEAEAFNQGMLTYNEPTQDFEREVISNQMHHNGNPVLTWQIGHCKVKPDPYGNKRPVKPKPEDDRKIDGVIASLMARAGGGKIRDWYRPGDGL